MLKQLDSIDISALTPSSPRNKKPPAFRLCLICPKGNSDFCLRSLYICWLSGCSYCRSSFWRRSSLSSLVTFRPLRHLEPIRITPEYPIYSKALMPLKGFRDEKNENKEPIQDFRRVMGKNWTVAADNLQAEIIYSFAAGSLFLARHLLRSYSNSTRIFS